MPDLTTLSAVKRWQGAISGGSTPITDEILGDLITATSADFLREIERVDLMAATYTETRIGDGSCRLIVRHWPLNSVATVNIAGTAIDPTLVDLDTSLDPERRFVVYLSGTTFTDGATVAVTYNAGYTDVPDDIAQAVIEWVVLRYNKKGATGQTQLRNKDGEHSDVDQEALPATTLRVIERYARKWPTYGRTESQKPGSSKAPQALMLAPAGK